MSEDASDINRIIHLLEMSKCNMDQNRELLETYERAYRTLLDLLETNEKLITVIDSYRRSRGAAESEIRSIIGADILKIGSSEEKRYYCQARGAPVPKGVIFCSKCEHILTYDNTGKYKKVTEEARVRVVLSSPDVEIEDCEEEKIWQGEYLVFGFAVELPGNYAKKQILFTAAVYINDIIATKLKFIVKCSSWRKQKIMADREDVLSAFVSYASQDRNRVARIIQGMRKARPDMDIFFDIENLRSGESWQNTLQTEIDRRDILFLCWSHFAKQSKWVDTEWRYAFNQKGADGIEPIPLESPSVCPPPEELSKKHFNDKMLFIINGGNTEV